MRRLLYLAELSSIPLTLIASRKTSRLFGRSSSFSIRELFQPLPQKSSHSPSSVDVLSKPSLSWTQRTWSPRTPPSAPLSPRATSKRSSITRTSVCSLPLWATPNLTRQRFSSKNLRKRPLSLLASRKNHNRRRGSTFQKCLNKINKRCRFGTMCRTVINTQLKWWW
jgi:hypothetical protein